MNRIKAYGCVLLVLALAACQSQPAPTGVRLGKPYAVDGQMYYPSYDPDYDKTGEASWYGPGFHGKYTASGEIFNQNDITAASPTLPMPSLVRVTNLRNGKSLIVRINDRGPFKSNRIIDLSKHTAELLGIRSLGRVRVQYLKDETERYVAERKRGDAPTMEEVNARPQPAQQIVEQTITSSHPGQTVSDAAPVMTVSEDTLQERRAPKPSHKLSLIKDARADDTVAADDPPVAPSPSSAPTSTQTTAGPQHYPALSPHAGAEKVATGGYIIQGGIFASEDNARRLVSMLGGDVPSSIDKIRLAGQTCWRVRFGPFGDRHVAEAVLDRIRNNGAPDAQVAKQ